MYSIGFVPLHSLGNTSRKNECFLSALPEWGRGGPTDRSPGISGFDQDTTSTSNHQMCLLEFSEESKKTPINEQGLLCPRLRVKSFYRTQVSNVQQWKIFQLTRLYLSCSGLSWRGQMLAAFLWWLLLGLLLGLLLAPTSILTPTVGVLLAATGCWQLPATLICLTHPLHPPQPARICYCYCYLSPNPRPHPGHVIQIWSLRLIAGTSITFSEQALNFSFENLVHWPTFVGVV